MKKIVSTLIAGILILFLTSFAEAQVAHLSVATGVEKPVEKAHVGLYIVNDGKYDISAIWGYDSNGNTSDYFSTGLEATHDVPKTRLFVNTNLRIVVGEDYTLNEYGRTEGLDVGLAYDFNIGLKVEEFLRVGSGISHFVAAEDNISLNPIFVKYSF